MDHRVAVVKLTPQSVVLLERLLELQNDVMTAVFAEEETPELERNVKSLGRVASKLYATAEKKREKA